MKIVFDNIIFSLQHAGGISSYWSELIVRLIRDGDDTLFIENESSNIARSGIAIEHDMILPRDKTLFFDRFATLKLEQIKEKFIFHSSYNRLTSNPNAIKVLTIHDFIHEKYYKGIRKFIHSTQKRKSIKAADLLIVISEHTKKDLLSYFPTLDPSKIKVIYNGVSDDFYPLANQLPNSSGRPFLLFLGSREMYKNFNFVVDVLENLPEFDLKIVGKALSTKEKSYLQQKIEGRYTIEIGIDNKRLNELYNTAFCLAYPSSYEGFGIPILEAMKVGCPFIALNKSSIPEVAGNAGVLMDELSIAYFVAGIDRIKLNRQEIIARGLEQVKKFSWEKCYQETKRCYQEFLEK